MPNQKPTVDSVTDGLAKLIREVRQLQSEVAKLTGALRGFTGGHQPQRGWKLLPPEAGIGGHPEARAETGEPRSAIRKIAYEFGDNPNLEIPTKTLIAIAKQIDGALTDIRAARNDIEAIADDSDLREEFRKWQASQKT